MPSIRDFLCIFVKKQTMSVDFLQAAELSAVVAGACLVATVVAGLIDLWTGCDCARRRGEKIESGKLRKTVAKLGDYCRVQALGIVADVLLIPFFSWPYLTIAITLGVIFIEGKSVVENLRSVKSAAGDALSNADELLRALTSRDLDRLRELLNKKDDKR